MDVYFDERYGKLCQLIEGGTCEVFDFKSSNGFIRNMFLKKPIFDIVQKDEFKEYYDIISPYGYGGPVILELNGDKKKLVEEFNIAFDEYCIQNKIVSEFIRFHPIVNNAQDFDVIYKPACIRKTLGTNLAAFDDPINFEFSKNCKRDIRKALREGVRYRINNSIPDINKFVEIYYSTMSRNKAKEFYFFRSKYFCDLADLFSNQILFVEALYEDKVIAASLCFCSDKNIYLHLSGTLQEYLTLLPAYILNYAIVLWGKDHDYNMVHYGGGVSNLENDTLYKFKKKFALNTEFDFYVGKKIRITEIYNLLCEIRNVNPNSDFFPAYRT